MIHMLLAGCRLDPGVKEHPTHCTATLSVGEEVSDWKECLDLVRGVFAATAALQSLA